MGYLINYDTISFAYLFRYQTVLSTYKIKFYAHFYLILDLYAFDFTDIVMNAFCPVVHAGNTISIIISNRNSSA